MAGTVNVSRNLWDDPTFKDSEMSQREAWIWMIAEASWKARTKWVGSIEVELQRGQLAASTRFLAKAWQWSEPRVRRYLDMLENRRMIVRAIDAGVTVITIGKYNEYQNGPRVTDAPSTRDVTQDRRTADANDKKGEIRDKRVSNDTQCAPKDAAPSFDEFWSAWPLGKVGKEPARKAFGRLSPQQRIGATAHATEWCGSWRAANPRLNDIHPATYLNNKRWQDEIQPTHQQFNVINGGQYDRQPSHDRRAASASDALARRLDAASRTH